MWLKSAYDFRHIHGNIRQTHLRINPETRNQLFRRNGLGVFTEPIGKIRQTIAIV